MWRYAREGKQRETSPQLKRCHISSVALCLGNFFDGAGRLLPRRCSFKICVLPPDVAVLGTASAGVLPDASEDRLAAAQRMQNLPSAWLRSQRMTSDSLYPHLLHFSHISHPVSFLTWSRKCNKEMSRSPNGQLQEHFSCFWGSFENNWPIVFQILGKKLFGFYN